MSFFACKADLIYHFFDVAVGGVDSLSVRAKIGLGLRLGLMIRWEGSSGQGLNLGQKQARASMCCFVGFHVDNDKIIPSSMAIALNLPHG